MGVVVVDRERRVDHAGVARRRASAAPTPCPRSRAGRRETAAGATARRGTRRPRWRTPTPGRRRARAASWTIGCGERLPVGAVTIAAGAGDRRVGVKPRAEPRQPAGVGREGVGRERHQHLAGAPRAAPEVQRAAEREPSRAIASDGRPVLARHLRRPVARAAVDEDQSRTAPTPALGGQDRPGSGRDRAPRRGRGRSRSRRRWPSRRRALPAVRRNVAATMLAPFANEPVLELRRAAVRAAARRCPGRVDAAAAAVGAGADRRRAPRPGTSCSRPIPGAPSGWSPAPPRPPRTTSRRRSTQARGGLRAVARRRAPAIAPARCVAAAAWMRERRLELAALEVRECAKPWLEADADVCEAIDFLEYYARGAIELGRGPRAAPGAGRAQRAELRPPRDRGRHLPVELPAGDPLRDDRGGAGDRQRGRAQARRAVARAGRAAGPGAAGRRRAAGGALRCCPARATSARRSSATPRWRRSPSPARCRSAARSCAAAAEIGDGQRHFKQVVAELGGKNCVIVDSDADLDEAVPAIVGSAFAYAGQKCSAASRVLVHEAIADSCWSGWPAPCACWWSARRRRSASTCRR